MVSLVNCQILKKKKLIPIFYKYFQKIIVGTLPNSFYKANITLILKPDKDITENENYKPISLVNTNIKFLTKYECIKSSNIYKRLYTLSRFIPGMEGWLNIHKSINVIDHIRIRNKKHMIISTDTKWAFDKIQHPFTVTLTQVWIEGNFLNLISHL